MGRSRATQAGLRRTIRPDVQETLERLKPTRRNFLLAMTGMTLVGCGGGSGGSGAESPAPEVPELPQQPATETKPAPKPEPAPAPVEVSAEVLLDAPMLDNLTPYSGGPLRFSRDSMATVLGASGFVATLAADQPHFAYDSYGLSYGVLIERGDTQPLLYTEQFDQAVWSATNVLLRSGQGAASDGSQRLWRISSGTASGAHGLSQSVSRLSAGSVITVNAVLKSDGNRNVGLQLQTRAGNFHVARFDLVGGSATMRFKALASGIRSLGGGLSHIWATFNVESGATVPAIALQLLDADGVSASFQGNGGAVLLSEMWLNSGNSWSSYIKAAGLAGSRAPDQLYLDTESGVRANDCSGIVAFRFDGVNKASSALWYSGIDENNYATVRITDAQIIFEKVANGLVTRCAHSLSWQHGRVYKIGWRTSRYTGMELVLDGRAVASNTSVNAKRDFNLGDRTFIGSDNRKRFCGFPMSNLMIFAEE